MVDEKTSKLPWPTCKLIWEEGKPIVECESKEDVTLATKAINEEGILIREVKVHTEKTEKKVEK